MKLKAQSIIEFAIILLVVTAFAVVSLQILNHLINSSDSTELSDTEQSMSQEEANCIENGLSWDKQNGVCEAK